MSGMSRVVTRGLARSHGIPVDPAYGPAPLLVARADELVELTVRSGPDRADAGEVRRVVVRPLRSEGALRYLDGFVKQNGAWMFAERRLMVDWTETRPSAT